MPPKEKQRGHESKRNLLPRTDQRLVALGQGRGGLLVRDRNHLFLIEDDDVRDS